MSLAQLSRLLPLPESDLQQALDYAATLSKQEAAEHFNNLLGESPQSIEFISSFNSRREDLVVPTRQSQASSSSSGVPKTTRAPKKKKPPLHTPTARQIQNTTYAVQGTAYTKKNEEDYISKRPSNQFALNTSKPDVIQAPIPRAPPSAAGHLISDLRPKAISKSLPSTRTSSPNPKAVTKVKITGGTPMHGASTTLTELDFAIRSLEISTNPRLSTQDNEKRACNCIATRHPLLAAAPNCLNCGKVICVKEGLGPCTFCGTALLSNDEIQEMIHELKVERGKERMAIDASAHRRPVVSKVPAPFSNPRAGGPTPGEQGMSAAEIAANEHRDRLLGFQAQNARRTTVRDEAADFETPDAGTGIWSSPAERARQLKKQQKVLREQEWNARPEYEKRRAIVSIDVVGGKVVRRMGTVERPVHADDDEKDDVGETVLAESNGNSAGPGKGTFSKNPLLGGLIKPVYHAGKGKGKGVDVSAAPEERKRSMWRRVQDDYEDNEEVILDGGIYGANSDTRERRLGREEHAVS